MRPHGSQEQLERRRRQAIELLNQGLTLSAVAQKIGCSVSSVHLWKNLHQEKGDDGLKPKPVPGRPQKMKPHQKRGLVQALLKGALKHGYSTDLWTARRVAEVIDRRYGVSYHPNHVWRLLLGLGWSCQKPEKRALQRNEAAIGHWKRYQLPHIKKRQKARSPSGVPG